jgi:protein-tyrosine phosphatase
MATVRSLGLTGALNARDLGGLATPDGRIVKRGMVFRDPALGRLTDEDVEVLRGLGLTDLLDLRHGSEIDSSPPDRLPPGPAVAHIPIFDPAHPVFTYVSALLLGHDLSQYAHLAVEGTPGAMLAIYRWFVESPEGRSAFGTAMRRIAAASGPLLYHCGAGKDRTGWLSAVLLGALGVDRATVLEDYVLTNEVTAPEIEKLLAILGERRGVPPEILRPVLAADPAYLASSYEAVEERYGSLDGYLRDGLRLDDEDLDALRNRLLA